MAENNLKTHTGIALLGLFFTVMSVLLIFTSIAALTGLTIPEFLRFNSESYNYIMLAIVNLFALFGLYYRVKGLWAATVIFIVLIIAGTALDMFFSGNAKYVFLFIYAVALVYIIAKPGRDWYGVE